MTAQTATSAPAAPAAAPAAAPTTASITVATAPHAEMGWTEKPFLGSKNTTNGDVLRETAITVGVVALSVTTAIGVAYAIQKLFGDERGLADAAFGGETFVL